MAQSAYTRFKDAHELPSPRGVALRILQLANESGATLEEISSAVESDPAISARLLKTANSPLVGMPRQLASVNRAVAMLGIRAVKNLALSFSLVSGNSSGPCEAFDYDLFWSESLARATASQSIVRCTKDFSPDEAFTCGLLCQVGRLALATARPESYSDAIETASSEKPEDLLELERAMFDIDHNELAAAMMADWFLPSLFCEAVRCQDETNRELAEAAPRSRRFAQVLALAGAITRVLTRRNVYRDELSRMVVQASRLGIAPDLFYEVFDSVTAEWREAGAIFSVGTKRVLALAEIYTQARDRRVPIHEASPSGGGELEEGGNCGR